MKPPTQSLQCHPKKCRTTLKTLFFCGATSGQTVVDVHTWPPEEKSSGDQDQEEDREEDDHSITHLHRSISKSITHRICVENTDSDEDENEKNYDQVDCEVTKLIQRIGSERGQRSHSKRNRPWPWTLLLLPLLFFTSTVVQAAFQQSITTSTSSSSTHLNHSSPPHITAQLPLTLISSPSSLLEGLLEEPSLEKAIRRLTDAWNDVHQITTTMISSKQVNQLLKGEDEKEKEAEVGGHNRTKRSHYQGSQPPAQAFIPSSSSSMNTATHTITSTTTTINGNCTRCRLKEEARSLRIETIKLNILNRLGLERPPNISRNALPNIPPLQGDLLLRQFQMQQQQPQGNGGARTVKVASANSHQKRHAGFGPIHQFESDYYADEYYVNPQKSFVFAQSPPPQRNVLPRHRAQFFKFPQSIINSHLEHATLWLYVNGSREYASSLDTSSVGHIHIYKVVPNVTSLKSTLVPNTKLNNKALSRADWIKVNVTALVREWLLRPTENLGLVIHTHESVHGTALPIVHFEDEASAGGGAASQMKPFIEVHVSPAHHHHNHHHHRSRRSNAPEFCDDKSTEVRCCRYPLTIDFESFGWEWIIAPKRYEANYCSGECGLIFMNGYPHTHLLQQTNHFNPTGPCCSPRRMSPISMLYMDSDFNIIYGILPNMVVDRCDCS